MAELCAFEDTCPQEEKEFQRVLALIGGREKIHLISDVGKSKEDDDMGILQEFQRDLFGQTSFSNGQPHSALPGNFDNERHTSCKTASATELPLTVRPKALTNPSEEVERNVRHGNQKTVARRDTHCTKRTIDSAVIIFILERLSDVKARTKHAKNTQPALIGLIRTSKVESAETEQSALVLETLMRSVFHRHVPDAMWVGTFIPKEEDKITEIKKNFCRVTYSSRTADNTEHRRDPLFWPFQCLLGPNRRTSRDRAKGNSTDNWQTGNPRDQGESIPLKTSHPTGPHVLDD
ncbi:hypothetical protein WMY93_024913 [Mugilogobius chulae]|uniref:Uncharacterized protein n=1 Tax=Mugilogobius chulae TaxID=88201 RepID=A0AAW0N2L1_9GOBI